MRNDVSLRATDGISPEEKYRVIQYLQARLLAAQWRYIEEKRTLDLTGRLMYLVSRVWPGRDLRTPSTPGRYTGYLQYPDATPRCAMLTPTAAAEVAVGFTCAQVVV